MILSIMHKPGIATLMPALLSFLVLSCYSGQKGGAANAQKSQSESTNGKVQQMTSNDLQIKEEILGLRQFLYPDYFCGRKT